MSAGSGAGGRVNARLEALGARFEADPGDTQAFTELEEHFFREGDFPALVRLYDRRLGSAALETDLREQAQILVRLGQVLEERLLDPDRAKRCYEEALQRQPRLRPALRALRRMLAARGEWSRAFELAAREAELPMRPFEKAALHAELGHAHLTAREDAAAALREFEHALAADSTNRAALEGQARALEALGRPAEAVHVWERLVADLRGGPDRAPALVAWARLLAGPLGQPERAIELHRRALTDDPRNADALDALVAAAAAKGQWTLLGELEERRFEQASGAGRRVTIALEAARLALERLEDPARARMWLARGLELAADDPKLHHAMAEVERRIGDRNALVRRLDRLVELAGDAAPLDVLLESATLHDELGSPERAIERLRRALSRAQDQDPILEQLIDLLLRVGKPEEVPDLLERRAALAASPGVSAAFLVDLGSIYETRLGDFDAARESYERAFEAAPATSGVVAALERLYHKLEAWEPLRRLLETALRSARGRDRVAVLCSLGELRAERLESPDGARLAFEEALAADRLCERALRGLERLAAASGDPDALLRTYEREAEVTSDPERLAFLVNELARGFEERERTEEALLWAERLLAAAPRDRRALELCARLHAKLGNTAELAEVLERLDAVLPPAERAGLRRERARHCAAAGDEAGALSGYLAALEAQPDDREALEAAAPLLERAGRLGELARVLRRLAELAPRGQRGPRLDALARLLSGPLADADAAIVVLWQLVGEPDAPRDANARLEALLELCGRYEELAQRLLERRHSTESDAAGATTLDLRRAEILVRRLGQLEEAAEIYRAILDGSPDCGEAVEGLEGVLRERGDAEGLAALLEARALQAERAGDPAARLRLLFERAVLLDERLDRDAEAREAYAALLAGGGDPAVLGEARRRLERRLERAGDWRGLRSGLEGMLEHAEPDEAFGLHERVARLCRDKLRDRDGAAAHLEAALRLRPERADLWQALALLYTEMDRLPDVLRALDGELASGPDPDRERVLRARAASLCAGALADPERARSEYARVLELDPTDVTAAEYCSRALEEAGQLADLATLLERRLEALPGERHGDARLGLRLRLGALRAGPLEDVAGALSVLEPALGEPGGEHVAATPLLELYRRAGRLEAQIALCRRMVQASPDAGERAEWCSALGQALAEKGDDAGAVDAYRRVLADRPGDQEAEEALCALHRRRGEAEPLARLLEAGLPQRSGPEELAPRLELAALLAGPLARPADAFVNLRRALEIAPGHAEALKSALALAAALGRPGDALQLVTAALPHTRDEAARARLELHRAELLAGPLGAPDRAVEPYREALRIDPALAEARSGLRRSLEALGAWPEALELGLREARAGSPEARASRLASVADLAFTRLPAEAALPWLERCLAGMPEDMPLLDRIAELHRRADRPESLLRVLGERLARTTRPGERRAVHLERARLFEVRLGAEAQALDELEAALRLSPDDPEILAALDRVCAALGRDVRRAEVLEARIRLAPVAGRAPLRRALATLLLERLDRPARAVELLEDALAEDEAAGAPRAEALQVLGHALRAAGRLERWAELGEQELARLDPTAPVFAERRHALAWELARAYEGPLGRPGDALVHLRALADEPPAGGDEATRERHAAERAAAEERLLDWLRRERSDVELSRRLAARLGRAGGDAAAWIELGRLREERLHTLGAAAVAYREALAQDPASREALRGLRRVAERLGDFAELARTLELELGLALPPRERAPLLRRLGEIAWRRLGSTTRASRAFAAALEADPGDRASLHALEELLETMEDWQGALALYESEIDMLGAREDERRRVVWLRVAELAAGRSRDPARAIRALEQADALAPLDPDRRRGLAELHRELGQRERYVEVLAAVCDDPAARASAGEWLALALALEALGRSDEALARVERALAVDAGRPDVWETAARLRQAHGDRRGAAGALEQAAELLPDVEAGAHLLEAAELLEGEDAARAAELLAVATRRDPRSAPAHATLARVAAGLGRHADAQEAATRALELAGSALPEELRRATAHLGGRSARALGRLEAADRFFATALALDPEDPEALAARAELRFALGDLVAAARAAEARLALQGPNPGRARQLAIVGAAREAADERGAARRAFEEALEVDAALDEARIGLVRVLRADGRPEDAIRLLDAWAETTDDPGRRAACRLEAAELAAGPAGQPAGAEERLRRLLAEDPRHLEASRRLAEQLWAEGRRDETLEVASRALDGAEALRGPDLGVLCLLRARALEARGEAHRAAEAYGAAAAADAGCADAALAQARLLRSLGEWRAAADALRRFLAVEAVDPARRAQVHLQLGRLLAGPLEDIEAAIDVLRAGVVLSPESREAREALADLLEQRSELWSEAVARHRELLATDPTRLASLRALMRIARARGASGVASDGLALLRALGAATPEERAAAPERLGLRLGAADSFENVVWEAARRLAKEGSDELASALGASSHPPQPGPGDAVGAYRLAVVAAEGELAAPALVPLRAAEAGAALSLLASLTLGPETVAGNGRLVNALTSALGRWSRRRLRRALGETRAAEIAEIDFEAWRRELRSLAHAAALDAVGGDLRAALVALVGEDSEAECEALDTDADLTAWVAARPAARELLRRVVVAWSAGL